MKQYRLYHEIAVDNQTTSKAFIKNDGKLSYDPKDARAYKVRNWLEIIKMVIELILKYGFKIKYEQITKN